MKNNFTSIPLQRKKYIFSFKNTNLSQKHFLLLPIKQEYPLQLIHIYVKWIYEVGFLRGGLWLIN